RVAGTLVEQAEHLGQARVATRVRFSQPGSAPTRRRGRAHPQPEAGGAVLVHGGDLVDQGADQCEGQPVVVLVLFVRAVEHVDDERVGLLGARHVQAAVGGLGDGEGARLVDGEAEVGDALVVEVAPAGGEGTDDEPHQAHVLGAGGDFELDWRRRVVHGRLPAAAADTASSTVGWIENTCVSPVISITFRMRGRVATSSTSLPRVRNRFSPLTSTPRPVESRKSTPSRSITSGADDADATSTICWRSWGAVATSISPCAASTVVPSCSVVSRRRSIGPPCTQVLGGVTVA